MALASQAGVSPLACPEHGGGRSALLAWRTLLATGECANFLCIGGHYVRLCGITPEDLPAVTGLAKMIKKLEAR